MSLREDDKSVEAARSDPEHLGRVDDLSLDDYDDPNFDPTATIFQDESPYFEVRAAVANTDDPRMPSSTFRAWAIGLIWAILIPGIDQVFEFRYPTASIDIIFILLLSLPMGKAWAHYMPNVSIFGISLNPGPFTIKEHVVIVAMANFGSEMPYSTFVIQVQRIFYNQHPNFIYQWLFVMSTQLIGFSIGGICQHVLVAPASMIWPSIFPLCAIFNTLHSQDTTGSWEHDGISRMHLFTYISIGYFFYNFFPSYLFTALSYFSWVCWIAPNHVKTNQLFGVIHGLGMGLVTFDWGQITPFNGSPLLTPCAYLPLMSSQVFDNTGSTYNLSRIINADGSFNLEAYQAYSPVFLPLSFAMCYGLSFASITAFLTHTLLYNSKHIWINAHHNLREQPDIHAHLMSVYKQVPNWWYFSLFGVCTISQVLNVHVIVCLLKFFHLAFMFTVPNGVLLGMSNNNIELNVITELIIGYALPHHPIAMMMFKTWGFAVMNQALTFTTYLKLGHYMKVPHHPMFFSLVIGIIVSSTDLCSSNQKDNFTCPSTITFGSSSIIWGVIGPEHIFSHGHMYYTVLFLFLVGAVAPLIQWICHKKFKLTFLKYVNFPLIFGGVACMPPVKPINFTSWVLICFLFNYIIRRRHLFWWLKYNYLHRCYRHRFALQYPKNGAIGLNTIQQWWGNTVYTKTADFRGVPYKEIPDGGKFGPSSW
ncbi:OPT oligopeptide transporter [Lactifluus volemus]|nr:OPT oligopeptide transporter [Lactifluus volemus]